MAALAKQADTFYIQSLCHFLRQQLRLTVAALSHPSGTDRNPCYSVIAAFAVFADAIGYEPSHAAGIRSFAHKLEAAQSLARFAVIVERRKAFREELALGLAFRLSPRQLFFAFGTNILIGIFIQKLTAKYAAAGINQIFYQLFHGLINRSRKPLYRFCGFLLS